jgi:hypothetical protein
MLFMAEEAVPLLVTARYDAPVEGFVPPQVAATG